MSFVPPFAQPEPISPAWFNLTSQPKRNKIFSEKTHNKHPQQVIDQIQRMGQKMAYIQQKIGSIPTQNTELVLGETIKCKDSEIIDKQKLIQKNKQTIKQLQSDLFRKNQQILDLSANLYFVKHYGQSIPFHLPDN